MSNEIMQPTPLTYPSLSCIRTLLAAICFIVIAISISGCQTSTGLSTDTARQSEAKTTTIVTATSPDTTPTPKPTQTSQKTSKVDTVVVIEEDNDYGDGNDDTEYLESYDDSEELSQPPYSTNPVQDDTSNNSAPEEKQLFEDNELESQTSGQPYDDDNYSTNPEEKESQEYPMEGDDESPVVPSKIYVVKPKAPDAKTVQQIMLERARQNSKYSTQSNQTIEDGNNIPAFRKMMDTGVKQLKQGQISAAESTFTRAQRLAPQSSAVYFYLGQVALKQNQPLKAEAMARRGLVVAQSKARKSALWQLILKAGQLQGNQRIINEAKVALANL